MFYSHQLLDRKSQLGQIWMAATMHAKINRRKLDKLNIIKICEEILNPSIPMALRFSGILMGGVVIVYERKVKLLYEDVTRLMVEINEAWKVKTAPDQKVLPKRKTQAKKDAITKSGNEEMTLGDIEQSLQFSNTEKWKDKISISENEEVVIGAGYIYPTSEAIHPIPPTPFQFGGTSNWFSPAERDEGVGTDPHQADPETITKEIEEPYQTYPFPDNRFERFSSQGDDEPIDLGDFFFENFSLIPSPTEVDMEEQNLGDPNIHQSNVVIEARQVPKRKRERRAHRTSMQQQPRRIIMDYRTIIIPNDQYGKWVQDASDLVGRMNKTSLSKKIVELKKRSLRVPNSRGSAPRHPQEPSASLSPGGHDGDFTGIHFEGFEMPNDNQIRSPPQGHDGDFTGILNASPISSSSGSGSSQDSQQSDKYTDLIKGQMKAHFEPPGAPKAESLDFFAAGMTRKKAARFFYKTLVLASRDFLKVEQKVDYDEDILISKGPILISKGPKM